jgi:hypothetical protein
MTLANTSPVPSINIKVDDKTHEVTMYFGRLHELAEVVQAYELLPEVDFNPTIRAAVLDICLSPRDERGRRIEGDSVNLHQLTVEDGEAVLDFAKEHLSDFFLGRLEWQLRAVQGSAERLTAVGSLLSGSAASASETR